MQSQDQKQQSAFIDADEFVKQVTKSFNESEIGRLFREGTPEQRQEIADALSNVFGGKFPPR